MENNIYSELMESLIEDYGDFLSDDEIESYSSELCEAIMCIEDIICELNDVSYDLDEAKKGSSVPKLIWRVLNKGQANEIAVGFDPRTFDSRGNEAGTNNGGGTIVAGPDKIKQWYNDKRKDNLDKDNKYRKGMDKYRSDKAKQNKKDTAHLNDKTKQTMQAHRDAMRKRKMREFDAAFKDKKVTPRSSMG